LSGTIRLTSNELSIVKNLTIRGPVAHPLAISSGTSKHGVHVYRGVSVTISHLIFKESKGATYGILNDNDESGPIFNEGTLTLSNSTVSGNSAFLGGGIVNLGTLTLNNSTVSGNSADTGGGIVNFGTLSLNNSTVSGNSAGGDGGGIYNFAFADTLSISNSTVSGNSASGKGGGIYNVGSKADITFCTIYGNKAVGNGVFIGNGGGLFIGDLDVNGTKAPSHVSIRNSIIAGDHAPTGPDISGRLTSDGYNLIQNLSGATFAPSKQYATDVLMDSGANLRIDPTLQDNGGYTKLHTFTHALLPGSPAIDQIPLSDCLVDGITTDQRGVKRPQGAACDIGAYEYVPSP
jgi:hypothetical protein